MITFESNQDFSTKLTKGWQTDVAFWTRYGQRAHAAHSQAKAAQHLHVVINHQAHQAEY